MTIKVVVHRLCDRCQRPIEEENLKYQDELPTFERRTLSATLTVTPPDSEEGVQATLFSFDDLCPDCDRVVEGFIKRIRLDSDKKPEKAADQAPEPEPEPEGSIVDLETDSTGVLGGSEPAEPEQQEEKSEDKESNAHLF